MELLDSRRLTGANVVCDGPGAVIDIAGADTVLAEAIARWREQARRMLDAVGWRDEQTGVRYCDGGASLAVTAPIDALYAATELNEWAWNSTTSQADESFDAAAARLRTLIEQERNPELIRLQQAAAEHKLIFLSDDDAASVGLGTGSQTWPVNDLPAPSDIDWPTLHDIPVALVTGTNGKTTSVRLAAAIVRAAGLHAGYSSTDCLVVGDKEIDQGDFAGPGGARTMLRHRQVEVAILETARGGLLRRGIGIPVARAALITRIARDHIGDFGSRNLDELLDAKWVVTRALHDDARLVLNADDAQLVSRAAVSPVPVVFFSLHADNPVVAKHVAVGGDAWILHDGELCVHAADRWQPVIAAAAIPLTMGGAARHNIGNALAAAALCDSLGIARDAIVRGLQSFDPRDNPGRGNLYDIDGVKVLIDFAHNPDAFRAIVGLASNLEARRRLIAFGEAGDRTDTLIRDLATIAWRLKPDRVITLEIEKYARGRDHGEVRALLHAQLIEEGARRDQLSHCETEMEALAKALAWAEPGDLIIFMSLEDKESVLERLDVLSTCA